MGHLFAGIVILLAIYMAYRPTEEVTEYIYDKDGNRVETRTRPLETTYYHKR
jgi:hypothetical protein